MQFGFYEMIRPRSTSGDLSKANKVRGWQRKKKRLTSRPVRLQNSLLLRLFFFFSLCRELFLLLFPVTSARYLETPRSFDHKRHRCKVAETISIVTDPYHRCAHFQCINHVPKVSEQKRGTSKHRDSLVGSKRSKEIERERAYCSPWDSRLFERR